MARKGIPVSGPYPATRCFTARRAASSRPSSRCTTTRGSPLKTLAFDTGVNSRSGSRSSAPRSTTHGVRHRREGCREPGEPARGRRARRDDGAPPDPGLKSLRPPRRPGGRGLRAKKSSASTFSVTGESSKRSYRRPICPPPTACSRSAPGMRPSPRRCRGLPACRRARDRSPSGACAARAVPGGGPVEVVDADILRFDVESLRPHAPLKCVSNLPTTSRRRCSTGCFAAAGCSACSC